MNLRNGNDDPGAGDGGRTASEGTPVAVDISHDRRARITLFVFLAGPVTGIAHFMLVYLVAEAGCTGDGPGLRLFNPPVPTTVTLSATAVAALACLGFAQWAFLRWRERKPDRGVNEGGDASDDLDASDRGGSLAFAGFLLSMLSFATVLLVGLPSIFLLAC